MYNLNQQKVFLKMLQNSQENTLCQSLFFSKVAGGAYFEEHLRPAASE